MSDRKRIRRRPTALAGLATLAACGAALACALAACEPMASDPGLSPAGIAAARTKWSQKEPAEYAYSIKMTCFCPYDTILVVADRDSVLSAIATGIGGGSGGHALPNPQAFSIDSLFAQLEAMRNRNPDKLFCHFDPAYGFPDSLVYDGSANAVDDELTRTVFGFHPVLTR